MMQITSLLPPDMRIEHMLALALIFVLWGLYAPILGTFGKGSLNSQLHAVRERWLSQHQSIERQHRVFDAILLGHISNSVSFFGSGTLIVLAGVFGALANVDSVYGMSRQLSFMATMSEGLFTLYFAALTLILALCFFAFTYALRKMAYTFAMLGGLQEASSASPQSLVMVEQAARVLTEAVRSINTGIRGFYYAVAALFLFTGPWISIAATLGITAILFYRQLFSPTAIAIGRYVEALNRLPK